MKKTESTYQLIFLCYYVRGGEDGKEIRGKGRKAKGTIHVRYTSRRSGLFLLYN